MKKIEVYETNDNNIFREKKLAIDHELALNMRKQLEEWIGNWYFRGIFESDIINEIIDNKDTLIKILLQEKNNEKTEKQIRM